MRGAVAQVQVKSTIERLKRERARLDSAISALEAIADNDEGTRPHSSAVHQAATAGHKGRRTRVAAHLRVLISDVLEKAGSPLTAAKIQERLHERGRNDTYQKVYAVLKTSPCFQKSGQRWTVRSQPELKE
jgi:hypothetical protein